MKHTKRRFLTVAVILLCVIATIVGAVFGINNMIKGRVAPRIVSFEQAAAMTQVDCILVLGCFVHEDGRPSDMLEDRLRRGIDLYQHGAAQKLLMSGDHGREDYNEVGAMKQYAIEAGVPSADIFMDHAGFSTYESLYRAQTIFGVDKILIVTQEYHLYRALYIAEALGIDAYGVSSDQRTYAGQASRELRETFARVKDMFFVLWRPEPTYLGEAIPISGNGDLTNDV